MVRKSWRSLILIGGIGILFLGLSAGPLQADAHCWAKVLCNFPGGSTFTNTSSWPNGSWPFSASEWATCRTNCDNYLFGLDLQGMAKERNVCGTVECTAIHWLGARPERACEGRRVEVPCQPPGSSDNKTDSQYAAKFVCGAAAAHPLVEDGDYKTTINVHNPLYQVVDLRYKAALAGIENDGQISNFVLSRIGPDAVQAFDCENIRRLLGSPPGLIDGFFVIQSSSPFDVTGYYTAARGQSTVIEVETITARAVPARDPLCATNAIINLADTNNWHKGNGNLAVPATVIGWDNTREWMSYVNDGIAGEHQDFTYQLDFCSCSPGSVRVTGNVESDNSALGELNTTTVANVPQLTPLFSVTGSGNFSGPPVPISGTPVSVAAGSGNIVMTVHNETNQTGVSVVGSLSLADGHVGACR
jgi:hypothetical protein